MFYLRFFDWSGASMMNTYPDMFNDYRKDFNTLGQSSNVRKVTALKDDPSIKGNLIVMNTWVKA